MGRIPAYLRLPLDLEWERRRITPADLEEVKNGHKSPPKGYPTDKSQYADPENYKWPLDEKHIHAAVSYFNAGSAEEGGYSEGEWATIGRKIAAAANHLIGAGHSYSNGKIITPTTAKRKGKGSRASEEEVWGDIIPTAIAGVGAEEISVQGEPAFQFIAMVIPGDAISRNTVPGKRGPTYYAAKRTQQYCEENNALIASLAQQGQRVTIYPRHAAAQLDAALPLGWVDEYFLKPSETRAGIEDVWYRGTILLTTEGRDTRSRMRAGLTKFSSLRTFEPPHFQTAPVKVNGQVVEEATKLLIAGVDLVATQPGLPVKPIQVLEEAATIEPYVEPAEATMPPASAAPVIPPVIPPAVPPAGDALASPPSQSSASDQDADHSVVTEEKSMKVKCPKCGESFNVSTDDNDDAKKAKEELDGAKTALTAAEAKTAALEAELAQLRTKSGEVPAAVTAQLEELTNRAAALEAEVKGYADMKAQLVAQKAQADAVAKVREIADADKGMGAYMRPLVEEAIAKEAITDPTAIAARYWQMRADKTDAFFRTQYGRNPAGVGRVSVSSATEENKGAAGSESGAGAGQQSSANGKRQLNEHEQSLQAMLGRML